MSYESGVWARVRQARNRLAADLADNPNVTLIDVGLAAGAAGATDAQPDELVLRVHLRKLDAESGEHGDEGVVSSSSMLPDMVDGFRVVAVRGDYRLENDHG